MQQDQQKRRPIKRKTRRQATTTVDYEQTIIPGHVYQSWLQNASDIVSRRGRKRKVTWEKLNDDTTNLNLNMQQ
jgi:cohesin complex subunit SCC1